jgi:hypothetical protein
MIVAPTGNFTMGSPPSEPGRDNDEIQVRVAIDRPFAPHCDATNALSPASAPALAAPASRATDRNRRE